MISREDYFEGVTVKKVSIIVVCVLLWMFIFGMLKSYAQVNMTKYPLVSSELTDDNWPTKFIHDNLIQCYQGTIGDCSFCQA